MRAICFVTAAPYDRTAVSRLCYVLNHIGLDKMRSQCRAAGRTYRGVWDVIIIGAGPAGLTGAAYLGRYRRSVLVLHDERSRARWIPTSHNTPGFPGGVGGEALLARLDCQARKYGATIVSERVQSIQSTEQRFIVKTERRSFQSHFVILAAGVIDKLPPIEGIEGGVERGVIRICPICDAYEAIDKSIAVLGDSVRGVREAEFLRTYSKSIALIHVGLDLDVVLSERIAASGIKLVLQDVHNIHIGERGVTLKCDEESLSFDVCYAALGCTPQNVLLAGLGAAIDASGSLIVNAHQETSVNGVYAAGDVVRGLNQIIVASAEGAIAATDIHNHLRAWNDV